MGSRLIYDGRPDKTIYYTPSVYDEVISDKNYYPLPGETAFDAGNVQGFEFGQFPTARSLGFSVSIRP